MDLLKAGESSLGFVKSFGMPLGLAKTACDIGSAFSYTSDLSQKALKSVKIAVGPADFAALALDTINLTRSFNVPKLDTAKISKLALSILKKGCDMLKWLERYRFITLEPVLLGRLKEVSLFRGLINASLRLREALEPASGTTLPADRNLMLLISKVLKSSLLLYDYLADDQRVKVLIRGIGFMGDGYSLYQKCHSVNPWEWTLTRAKACQIISSIALASLAFYAIEKGFFTENGR